MRLWLSDKEQSSSRRQYIASNRPGSECPAELVVHSVYKERYLRRPAQILVASASACDTFLEGPWLGPLHGPFHGPFVCGMRLHCVDKGEVQLQACSFPSNEFQQLGRFPTQRGSCVRTCNDYHWLSCHAKGIQSRHQTWCAI